jgi:hypothetical protein
MNARYQTPLALAFGVGAGWLANWLVTNAMARIFEGGAHNPNTAPWIVAFYSCAFVISLMVPGFVAGLIVTRRGILVGAFAAAILAVIAISSEVLTLTLNADRTLAEAFQMMPSVISQYPASIIGSAVAGGCAQALRSNNSLERTRVR